MVSELKSGFLPARQADMQLALYTTRSAPLSRPFGQCPCRECSPPEGRPWRFTQDIQDAMDTADIHDVTVNMKGGRQLQRSAGQFALGGVVTTGQGKPEKVPEVSSGLPGFSHAEFVAGTVRGYRWWSTDVPPLELSPSGPGSTWRPGRLRGQKDFWDPGVNTAACKSDAYRSHPHDPATIPERACGCGFWAYWHVKRHDLGGFSSALPVVGVVEGSGKVIVGPEGFRAARAKIIAIYLPFLIHPDIEEGKPRDVFGNPYVPGAPASDGSLGAALVRSPRFTGQILNYPGRDPDTGSYRSMSVPPPAELIPPEPALPDEEEIQESRDRADAWHAMIGFRLSELYPDAEICESMSYMRAMYPVVSEYPDT